MSKAGADAPSEDELFELKEYLFFLKDIHDRDEDFSDAVKAFVSIQGSLTTTARTRWLTFFKDLRVTLIGDTLFLHFKTVLLALPDPDLSSSRFFAPCFSSSSSSEVQASKVRPPPVPLASHSVLTPPPSPPPPAHQQQAVDARDGELDDGVRGCRKDDT